MPKNPEKKEWPQLSDEQKRVEEERLKKEEEEIKETGWEKFEERHKLIKEVTEKIEVKKAKEEVISEKGANLEEAKLTEEREKLPEAYGEISEDKEKEKEAERLIKETEDELNQKLDQERGPSGKKLSDTEIYTLSRNFYLGKLDYEIKYRGLLGGKARIWSEQNGGYVINEKTGKPVEFKTAFSPKGETPFLKFLKEEYKNKIKEDLKKKYQEKEEVMEKGDETPLVQKEEAELEKKPLNASEFFANYLRANDLDEEDLTPAHLKEARKRWKAYQKEMGIEPPEKKKREEKTETAKVVTREEKIKPVETKKAERKEIKIPPSIIRKLREFFEGFKIESDERKRTGIDRQIQKVLDGLRVGKVDLAEKEISRMLANSKRNLETAKEKKNPRLAKQHENNIEKLEGLLKEIKSPAETEKTEMTTEQLSEAIESAIENTQKNREKEKEEREVSQGVKIDWLEKGIQKIETGGLPTVISKKLEGYLIENEIPKDKIDKMTPEEAWQEAAKFYKQPGTRQQEKTAVEQIPEISLDLDQEEGLERSPKKKEKKKESTGRGKRLEWLEHVIKLRENGEWGNGKFKPKIINQLRRFLIDKGISEEEIHRMKANPKEAWEKAIEIYEKEKREAKEQDASRVEIPSKGEK